MSNLISLKEQLRERIEVVNAQIEKLEKERSNLYGLLEVYEPEEASLVKDDNSPDSLEETERMKRYKKLINMADELETKGDFQQASALWLQAMDYAKTRGKDVCKKGIERCEQAVLSQTPQ